MGQYAAALGVTRWISGISESSAIKYGTLTDNEKEIYRAVFYNRTATITMINEAKEIKESTSVVKAYGVPQVPMLLFISNGSGGTGFDEKTWRTIPKEYISKSDSAIYIELDCPHYVHDYMYEEISSEIKNFFN